MYETRVGVGAQIPELVAVASELSEALNVPNVGLVTDTRFLEVEELLWCTPEGLKLQATGKKAPGPTWCDFVSGAVAHRRKFGGGRGQMIAKAVGLKQGVTPSVLDATAGLGKDSFVLATLGCHVKMVERSPVVHALLSDGLARALLDEETAPIAERMSLVHGDAIDHLASLIGQEDNPQVVYLDPMFPHSEKSALVKKEMRAFRGIVGDDNDASRLLENALQVASGRVVVKRPRKAPTIDDRVPNHQLEGKSSRYDIYTLSKLS
jgi:16S rRNA (guanine1516-N2)-methyltransferase